MPLESATYIGQLVPANPAATDPKSQGDDHLRLIKAALQNSLPGMTAAGTFSVTLSTPTAAQFNNSTTLATTAFVQRALGSLSGSLDVVTTPVSLVAADVGKLINAYSAAAVVNLPNGSGLVAGAGFTLYTANNLTVNTAGGQLLVPFPGAGGGGVTSTSIPSNTTALLVWNGASWSLGVHGAGLVLLSSNGYQKLPSGLILQWGTVSATAVSGGITAAAYPLRFPTACLMVTGGRDAPGSNAVMLVGIASGDPTGQVLFQNYAASVETGKYFAIGY